MVCAGLSRAEEGGAGKRNDPPPYVKPELPAFPGAEGFGAMSTGGRGGKVIKVTNLNESGPGSFAEACAADGPRIVVFDVSGVIKTGKDLSTKLFIKSPNITIAGQTAPGAGITIEGYLSNQGIKGSGNMIVRFLRIRPRAKKGNNRTVEFNGEQDRNIVDHLSLSWGADDTCSMCSNTNVTAQWLNIEESDIHLEGGDEPHNFGGMFACYGPGNATMHHCLFAHHHERAPLTAADPIDYRNNVLYNVGTGFMTHPARMNQRQRGKNYDANLVGNYCKYGPGAIIGARLYMPPYALTTARVGPGGSANPYLEGNFHDWNGGYLELGAKGSKEVAEKLHNTPPLPTQTAEEAYEWVLAVGGCLPRDAVSRRMAHEVRTRTGQWGRFEPDAGLMEGLTPGAPRPDADSDGMSDEWEKARGLNPNDAADASKVVPAGASRGDRHKGYTYIEYYINELADDLIARAYVDYRLADEPTKADYGPATKLTDPLKPVDELVATIKAQSKEAGQKTDPAWYAVQMLSRMGEAGKGAVKPLVEVLGGDDPQSVVFACYGLGAVGPAAKEAVPGLIKVLEKDWGVPNTKWQFCPSGWAVWALGRIGPDAKEAVPALARAMSGKDLWGRGQAVWALSRMGREAAPALDELAKQLGSDSYAMRALARDAMIAIGEPAVPTLVKAIEGGKSEAAAEAAGRLGKLAKAALPGLVKMSGGGEPKARAAALEALCLIDPAADGVAQVLAAALADEELMVRHRAAKALCAAGPAGKHSVEALAKALSDKAAEVRGAAAEALGAFGAAGVPALVKCLESSDDGWARTKCARALGRVAPAAKEAVGPLAKALADKDERVRADAAIALAWIGPEAKGAIEPLKKAAEDGDYVVRAAAAAALRRIQGN